MSLTLLQLVQRVSYELGLTAPNAVVSSADTQVLQLLHLANAVGQTLVTEFDWNRLQRQFQMTTAYANTTGNLTSNSAVISVASSTGIDNTFGIIGNGVPQWSTVQSVDSSTQITMSDPATVTTNSVSLQFGKQAYSLTSAFDRIANRTQWDRSMHWRVLGPESPQVWQWLKGGIVATGPRMRFRIQANMVQIFPIPTTSNNVYFEYVANTWIASNTNAVPTLAAYTSDAEIAVFPDRLMIEGLKLRFYEIKGFDTTALQASFTRELEKAKAQDKGAPTLNLGSRSPQMFISPANVRDADFGTTP